jgi:hypothetical protein
MGRSLHFVPGQSIAMHVVFPRLADGAENQAIVHRDDGVVYRVRGNGQRCGPELPHDLAHFVVERALGITDGFWGSVASGAVFTSMSHVSGRRRPHAAETSKAIKRDQRTAVQYAERMVWIVEQIDDGRTGFGPVPREDDAAIRRFTARALSTLPPPYPEPDQIRPALTALDEAKARWRALAPGDELALTWPRQRVVTRSAAPRTS